MVGASNRVSPNTKPMGAQEVIRHTDRNTSNPNPFLHDLQPDHKLHSATGMKISRALASEHCPIGGTISRFFLEVGNGANFLELCFCLFLVFSFVPAQSAQNVTGLIFTSNLDKPSGRFWEPPNNDEKE
jgi:hypothetical protein